MNHQAAILLYIELLFTLLLLWREGLLFSRRAQWLSLITVAGAFLVRALCMDYQTLDYQDWISVWVQAFRDEGAWTGLSHSIWSCNYNVPYLYFLALFSKSGIPDLYLVKTLSVLFDVFLALTVSRLVALMSDSVSRRLVAFIGTLWLPTVILNGSLWGQCDSIYVFFAVWSIYLVLRDRPYAGVAAAAVSLSFKLQGIFVLPALGVLFFAKKLKPRHLTVFPMAYIATLIPALLAGRSFTELITFYYNNIATVGSGLNYNSPSLYAAFSFTGIEPEYAAKIGILLAFGLCALLYIVLILFYGRLSDTRTLALCLLLVIGVPLFLPHMHDRYFYMADLLSFALACVVPALWFIPALVSFASLICYYCYLKMAFLVPLRYGFYALCLCETVLLLFCAQPFCKRFFKKEKTS